MLIHSNPLYRVYFGDSRDKLFSKDYLNLPKDKNILDIQPFNGLKKIMGLDNLIFLNQVHGSDGLVLHSNKNEEAILPFSVDGDFIVTNITGLGIGIMTADCLPIILFDKLKHVIAIIHAGWRSATKSIVVKAIDEMKKSFNTNIDDISVIFGPSAKVCCYKVSDDFLDHVLGFDFLERVIQKRSDGIYFDLLMFNILLLETLGIKKSSFNIKYSDCTVCDNTFFSYRRQGKESGRQMTIACLK